MPTYTLTYADHSDAAATIELTIEAMDDRWAMGQASDILAAEPGNNAWVLRSITEAPTVTETPAPTVPSA